MKLLTDLHQITDISGPPDFSRNTIQLTLFDLYIRTLYTSKRNQIYYKSSSTNISEHHQTYTYALQIKIHMDLNWITNILDNYQTSRGTQFNLTLFDLYIRTLYTSKSNQIYYKSSSTNISDHHRTYTNALQIKIQMDMN